MKNFVMRFKESHEDLNSLKDLSMEYPHIVQINSSELSIKLQICLLEKLHSLVTKET